MDSKLDFKLVGSRIQKYRAEKNMTQTELAEIIGTTQKHLSRIESGYHRSNFDTIVAITKALDIPIDVLTADFDDSTNPSTIKLIMEDVKKMNPKQLKMLQENIQTIKKLV